MSFDDLVGYKSLILLKFWGEIFYSWYQSNTYREDAIHQTSNFSHNEAVSEAFEEAKGA